MSLRDGDGVLQASGLEQHGAAVVPLPDQAELRGPEGAGGPGAGFPSECDPSQSAVRPGALYRR